MYYLSTFKLLHFQNNNLLLHLFHYLLFFHFLNYFLFHFLRFLCPFLRAFVPFLVFFLINNSNGSMPIKRIRIYRIPRRLKYIIIPITILAGRITSRIPFSCHLLYIHRFNGSFRPLFLIRYRELILSTRGQRVSPLGLNGRNRVGRAILMLHRQTFKVIILASGLLHINGNLFSKGLFRALIPFLRYPSDSKNNFLPLCLRMARFKFYLSCPCVNLCPTFLLRTTGFLRLSNMFLISTLGNLCHLFMLLQLNRPLFLQYFKNF